jgi:hypothetical protein
MKAASLVLALSMGLGATVAVYANTDEAEPAHAGHAMHHPGAEFSVEHAAMHNLIVAALSVKTGRSQDEIAKLFEQQGHSPEVLKQLGVDEDTMHGLMINAHKALVERMLTANLITPDQAQKLRDAPLPLHHHPDREHGGAEPQ